MWYHFQSGHIDLKFCKCDKMIKDCSSFSTCMSERILRLRKQT